MATCIHGMNEAYCATCNPGPKVDKKKKRRIPTKSTSTGVASTVRTFGSIKSTDHFPKSTAVCVHPKRGHHSFTDLDARTTLVHLSGHPFLWTIQEIVNRAPNIQTLQMIPTMWKKLTDSHRVLCKTHNITIRSGYWAPERAWETGRIVNPAYKLQRDFLLDLGGDQKKLFEELLVLGFDSAHFVSRYFCLSDEAHISQAVLIERYGYKSNVAATIGARWVNGVLYYLDPSLEASKDAQRISSTLTSQVYRLRIFAKEYKVKNAIFEKYGLKVQQVSKHLPPARFELWCACKGAYVSGRLSEFGDVRTTEVLILRYGLAGSCFKTLQQVGNLLDISGERVRQLEERMLQFLNISIE